MSPLVHRILHYMFFALCVVGFIYFVANYAKTLKETTEYARVIMIVGFVLACTLPTLLFMTIIPAYCPNCNFRLKISRTSRHGVGLKGRQVAYGCKNCEKVY